MSQYFPDLVFSLVLAILFGWLAFSLTRRGRLAFFPYAISFFLLLPLGLLFNLPESPYFQPSDGLYYQAWAVEILNGSGERRIWPGKGVWPLILAGFFLPVGSLTISIIFLNASITSFVLVISQKTVQLLTFKDSPWRTAALYLSSTPVLFFGSSLLREPIVWLGASLCVLGLSYLSKRVLPHGVVMSIAGFVVFLAIRPDAAVILLYPLVALTLAYFLVRPSVFSIPKLWGFALGVAALTASFPPALAFVRPGLQLTGLTAARKELSEQATTSFLQQKGGIDPDSTIAVVENWLANLVPYLFGPYWWTLEQTPILWISAFSTFHFWLVLLLAAYGTQLTWSKTPAGVILVWGLVALAIFSVLLTNYGIIIRFRQVIEVMILPLAVIGLSRWPRKNLTAWRDRFWPGKESESV